MSDDDFLWRHYLSTMKKADNNGANFSRLNNLHNLLYDSYVGLYMETLKYFIGLIIDKSKMMGGETVRKVIDIRESEKINLFFTIEAKSDVVTVNLIRYNKTIKKIDVIDASILSIDDTDRQMVINDIEDTLKMYLSKSIIAYIIKANEILVNHINAMKQFG